MLEEVFIDLHNLAFQLRTRFSRLKGGLMCFKFQHLKGEDRNSPLKANLSTLSFRLHKKGCARRGMSDKVKITSCHISALLITPHPSRLARHLPLKGKAY